MPHIRGIGSHGRGVREDDDVKIGLIVARHGPAELRAFGCDSCATLAAAELNASGGVLDRELEIVLADAGTTGAEARFAVRTLVELDQVDAVVSIHASNLRVSMAQAIAGRVPYVYAPMYEGGERTHNVLAIGGTDEELLSHAIPALMERRRAQRFFVFGNDYIWPRFAAVSARGTSSRDTGGRGWHESRPRRIENYSEMLGETAG